MATAVVNPPSPGSLYAPISNESILESEAVSMQNHENRQTRRSTDAHRRRSRGRKDPSGTRRNPSLSQSPYGEREGSISGAQRASEDSSRGRARHDSMRNNTGLSSTGIAPVAPPPKERLPPSPPLTPVASQSSLRKTASIASVSASMPKQSQRRALRDSVLDTDDETEQRDLYHQDGEAAVDIARKSSEDGRISSLARSTSNVAEPHPLSSPQPPALPVKTPLDAIETTTFSSSHNGYPIPVNQEASTSTSPPPRNDLSPQPWDLIDPPANNNLLGPSEGLEERAQRNRKMSSKSARSTRHLVVKDGKKYRVPHSSYYFGPPPPGTSAYGSEPIGHIGVNYPREIVRIERDYAGGELIQFSPAYPLELEGRINPSQFLETINAINEILVSAHSLRWSFFDNTLAVLTLYISRLFLRSHYEKEMRRLWALIDGLNKQLYNPVGLNILWPKEVAFMFLEIEYY